MNAYKRSALALLALLAAALATGAGCDSAGQRQLTVLLVEYRGPEALSSAQRVGGELSTQGLRDVFIVQGPDEASLCVGHFNSWKDKDADETLKRVRQIRDAAGQYPFAGVMLVPVPEATPENPWPLEKAQGIFTLHVASWEAPGRTAKAQAYAAELRSQGYEAYVYHGPRLSMVTIGAFGPEILDAPGLAGQPGAKPKVVSPQVQELIRRFPRMRLEGELTPPEAHIPTQLVKVPGREGPVAPPPPPGSTAVYRVLLTLVDARTGAVQTRGRAQAATHLKEAVPPMAAALTKQILNALPADRPVRIGVLSPMADTEAARERVDAAAVESIEATLSQAGQGRVTVVAPAATQEILKAAGITVAAAQRDPRVIRGLGDIDYVLTSVVTSR
jgi:hypothetical protein